MRSLITAVALCAMALPAAAQHAEHGAGHGTGRLPEGWQGRVDRPTQKIEEVNMMSMGSGYHVITGPHAILWNPALTGSGTFRAVANLEQRKAPERLEGYGIFVGGRNLADDTQDYLYFLIRHDGRYMIRHRAGTEVHTLVDWTPSDAIRTPAADRGASNAVSIESDTEQVRFRINGTVVRSFDRVPMLNTDGIVGLRIGHHVDVHVPSLTVQPLK